MSDTVTIVIVLSAFVAVLLVAAHPISAALVGLRARRLPIELALRMEEEWLGELNSISSRPGKLAFAVALLLTRRRAFVAPGEIIVSEIAAFGSRKSLVILSAVVFAIAAYGASFLVPVKYESETLLAIKNQDDFVLMQTRSNSLFESVVKVLPDGGAGSRERWLEDLRNNITIAPLVGSSNSSTSLLKMKYLGPDPVTAQKVIATLTTSLIERNFSHQINQSHEQERFLQSQLERLGARMKDKGEELALLRATNGPTAGAMLALDHELLVSSYKELFAKHNDLQVAAFLQPSMFGVVDPAQLGKAVEPNRAAFAGVGAGNYAD
jgi:hypothetical protein